jgi:hypothetical protein
MYIVCVNIAICASAHRPQSETQLTKKELLALAAEMDGTAESEEKSEEKRQEDERWAQFKDKNPRGWGNTMNRG